MKILDYNGNELYIGARVLFGAPSTDEEKKKQLGRITAISEPDVRYNPVTDADDGGYGCDVTVTFEDGEVETVYAGIISTYHFYDQEAEPDFEAGDDIELAWVTKKGTILVDADIQKLADEAEKGYDFSKLVPREGS